MVIFWHKQAIRDLKEYKQNSNILTDEKLNKYITSIVNYIDILELSPYLGKIFCIIDKKEIRQLIFEIHRIFYYIHNDKIYILSIIHTSRNVDNVIKHLHNSIDYI